MNAVQQYYDAQAEEEWKRLEHHRMEFAITMRVLQENLDRPPLRLLDIGGGPGRYSIALAKRGYSVTLVDLSTASLQLAARKTQEAGVQLEAILHLNALDLSQISPTSYDAVLLMGPLYHLLKLEERRQAIGEACRVLRPAGLFCASVITRFAPFHDAAAQNIAWVIKDPAYSLRMLQTGIHDNGDGFTTAYFTHPDEFEPLMAGAGLHTLGIYGVEGVVADHEELGNQLKGADWELWVELNYRMSQEPSLRGAADHLLYVGRKPVGGD